MNVAKLLKRLGELSGCRPADASLSVGEIWEGGPTLYLDGLSDCEKVEFSRALGKENFPADWLSAVSSVDVAFAELSREIIEGVRRTISGRVSELTWGLSLPNLTEQELLDQGAQLIVKLSDFRTLALLWQVDIYSMKYYSLSVRQIPLGSVLSGVNLQEIFSDCKR